MSDRRRRPLGPGPLGGLLATAALLAGCAGSPPRPAAAGDSHHSGRLVLQVVGDPARSFSAGFELTGSARAGELTLSTPLGTTAARARWEPGQARLQADGRDERFDSPQALVDQALGQPLPLAALFDWLQARPWPGAASVPLPQGQTGFAQLGWQVDLARWSEGWLVAAQDGPPPVRVRIRLDRDTAP